MVEYNLGSKGETRIFYMEGGAWYAETYLGLDNAIVCVLTHFQRNFRVGEVLQRNLCKILQKYFAFYSDEIEN